MSVNLVEAITEVLIQGYYQEVPRAKEGRAMGRTGLVYVRGCADDDAVCAPEDWASCACFIQACAIAVRLGESGGEA